MTVEVARTINELDKSFPRNVDLIREGDDHIRLIKEVLKNTFPNVKGVVNIAHDKLNNIDKAFKSVDVNGNIVFEGAVSLTANKAFNANGNRIQNVAIPVELNDAVNVAYLASTEFKNALYPIGYPYITFDDTSPATILGFGTWTKVGAGRILSLAGANNDTSGEANTYKLGANDDKAAYSTKLVAENVPLHDHEVDLETTDSGLHSHGEKLGVGTASPEGQADWDAARINWGNLGRTTEDGLHKHRVTGRTKGYGKGDAFSRRLPTFGINLWRRTA